MPKIQESNNGFYVRLPKELVLLKKWGKGTQVVIMFNERGNLEVRSA